LFSLIIVLVSIALVVVLAVATIYYGGKTSHNAASKATATTLINQASQIAAAGTLAVSQGSGWPASAGPMFSQPYLTAMPVPPKNAYTAEAAVPVAVDWQYYLNQALDGMSSHHFALVKKVNEKTCLAVNQQQGVTGIPSSWDGKTLVQCFGTGRPLVAGGEKVYTFFYDPIGTTAAQDQAAIDKSERDASTDLGSSPVDAHPSDDPSTPTTPVTSSDNGYPKLCPSGLWISAGACSGAPATPPVTGTPVTPPATGTIFVRDSFTGTDGTMIHSHAPDIGGTWIRRYDLQGNYEWTDCNFETRGGKLSAPVDMWTCGSNMYILNDAPAPTTDYEVSMDFTVSNYEGGSAYVEMVLLGRATMDAAGNLLEGVLGYLYIDGRSGNAYVEIENWADGSTYADLPTSVLTNGATNTLRMKMEGPVITLYLNGVQVHTDSFPTVAGSGFAGFAMNHGRMSNAEDVKLDNFLAR
jgi:hypothetical protein